MLFSLEAPTGSNPVTFFLALWLIGDCALMIGHLGNGRAWWRLRGWPFLDSEEARHHYAAAGACVVLALLAGWFESHAPR